MDESEYAPAAMGSPRRACGGRAGCKPTLALMKLRDLTCNCSMGAQPLRGHEQAAEPQGADPFSPGCSPIAHYRRRHSPRG